MKKRNLQTKMLLPAVPSSYELIVAWMELEKNDRSMAVAGEGKMEIYGTGPGTPYPTRKGPCPSLLNQTEKVMIEKAFNRGDLRVCMEFLRSLPLRKHKQSLYKTPFKVLFKALIEQKIDVKIFTKNLDDLKMVLTAYDNKTSTITLNGRPILLTEDHIRSFFGIIDGRKTFDVKPGMKVDNIDFVKRNYLDHMTKRIKLTKALIESRLRKQKDSKKVNSDDFAVNAVLYLLAEGLLTNKGENIGRKYIDYIANFENSGKVNWSHGILAHMNASQKGKAYEDDNSHKGCWLYANPDNLSQKITMKELAYILLEDEISNLVVDFWCDHLVKSANTKKEQDEFAVFDSLIGEYMSCANNKTGGAMDEESTKIQLEELKFDALYTEKTLFFPAKVVIGC